MCLLFTIVSLTIVGVASPFRVPVRPNDAQARSKKCFFIFLKARLGHLFARHNFADITSCFASLAVAGDDRHSNCENSTMYELNSTENSQVFSVIGVGFAVI